MSSPTVPILQIQSNPVPTARTSADQEVVVSDFNFWMTAPDQDLDPKVEMLLPGDLAETAESPDEMVDPDEEPVENIDKPKLKNDVAEPQLVKPTFDSQPDEMVLAKLTDTPVGDVETGALQVEQKTTVLLPPKPTMSQTIFERNALSTQENRGPQVDHDLARSQDRPDKEPAKTQPAIVPQQRTASGISDLVGVMPVSRDPQMRTEDGARFQKPQPVHPMVTQSTTPTAPVVPLSKGQVEEPLDKIRRDVPLPAADAPRPRSEMPVAPRIDVPAAGPGPSQQPAVAFNPFLVASDRAKEIDTESIQLINAPGTRPHSEMVAPQSSAPVPQHTPQAARMVASQMAVAVMHNGPGTTEIMLSPEELGRVRMVVTAQDMAISVVIHADRPETSDLLRRHIETLAQEFKGMGFETANFTFAGGGQEQKAATDVPAADENAAVSPETGEVVASPAYRTSGLDLRL